MTKVVFLLTSRLHLLDLAGPAQVFTTAADLGLDYRCHYVAEHEEIVTAQGITVRAHLDWPTVAAGDLIVVPGWSSARGRSQSLAGAATLARLADHHARGGTLASVCSGAYLLGQAGLLDGRRCTTHHELQDDLARRFPRAEVIRDVLYTVDGPLMASAGIASGIDLALGIVARRDGPAFAARVARGMVIYLRRNGDASQHSALLRHRGHVSDVVHQVQDEIDAGFREPLRLTGLARRVAVSPRTLSRRFAAATGLTPLRYQQILRAEHAEQLLDNGATMDLAARSVGFTDARMLRRLRVRDQDSGRARRLKPLMAGVMLG